MNNSWANDSVIAENVVPTITADIAMATALEFKKNRSKDF